MSKYFGSTNKELPVDYEKFVNRTLNFCIGHTQKRIVHNPDIAKNKLILPGKHSKNIAEFCENESELSKEMLRNDIKEYRQSLEAEDEIDLKKYLKIDHIEDEFVDILKESFALFKDNNKNHVIKKKREKKKRRPKIFKEEHNEFIKGILDREEETEITLKEISTKVKAEFPGLKFSLETIRKAIV